MTEIVLIIVIVLLGSLLGWFDYNNRKERAKLINAIISKDSADIVNLELADKTEIKVKNPEEPDFVPLEGLSDKEYIEKITGKE